MKKTKLLFLTALAVGVSLSSLQAETLTYQDLVHRLTDLDHLAVSPLAGENGALASSYDRSRKYDAASDKYLNWAANNDGGGVIRQEGDVSVLAEIKGPGVIWRIWSARPTEGYIKIYLDGDPAPSVNLPFSGYFDGKHAPFTRPNLVYKVSAGFDNYTPIPFQKSCKITADKNWGDFYHFNYSTFPEGTVVPTFKLPLSDEDNAALDQADKILGQCGQDPAGTRAGQETKAVSVTVNAGEKASVADFSGEGAITALKVKFDLPADKEAQKNLLRQLALSITWDDDNAPAVWSPIGDFFGDAVIPATYQSLPTGITKDGIWYSYWYMPYASGAHIQIENDSDQPVAMDWEVTHAPLTQPIGSLLRFHAKWHRDAFLPERKDRWPDWTLLKTGGTGRYVGTQLDVWSPRDGWWGEGDEKWFVNGEKFPSTIGTGTEDYFGYAWGYNATFSKPFHGEAVNEDGWNHGHISLHRWHITDNIPFQTTFEGCIEKYFSNERPTLYAAAVFWYLSPGGTDSYGPVLVSERIGYWTPLVIYREPGAIEGEDLRATTKGQSLQGQDMWTLGKDWSGDRQLLWKPKAVNDHCEFDLKAPQTGKYKLVLRFTHAPDYGIVQVSVNGMKVSQPVDLYGTQVVAADPVDLGAVDLKNGSNVLAFDIAGKNDKAKGYCMGLDYLKLVPVP